MDIINIFSIIDYAKNNNGLYTFRYHSNIKTNEEKIRALESLFHFELEMPFLCGKLFYSKSKNNSKLKLQELNRIVKKSEGCFLTIDVYELFHTPENKKNIESLDIFRNLFESISNFHRENVLLYSSFFYENKPKSHLKYELIKKTKDSSNNETQEKESHFINELLKHEPLLSNWQIKTAKSISLLGRWSWINIQYTGLFDEEFLYDKYLPMLRTENKKLK